MNDAARPSIRLAVGVFALCYAYAVVRYVVCGPVDPAHLPLYITNKAIAFSGLTVMGIAIALGPLRRLFGVGGSLCARTLGWVGFSLVLAHVGTTVAILSPEYFAKLYRDDGTLTASAELAVLAGITGTSLLVWQAWSARAFFDTAPDAIVPRQMRAIRTAAVFAGACHVLALGVKGWLAPEGWHGGLPPITMLAFIVAFVPLSLRAVAPRAVGDVAPADSAAE